MATPRTAAVVLSAGLSIVAGIAGAQAPRGPGAQAPGGPGDYPARPIRLILPQSPGGPTDIIGRTVAQKLSENVGQPVVADNRAGAAGSLGCELAARAAPDGYTLLLGPPGCLTVNPSLYPRLGYDTLRDFAPITQLTSGPEMLVVHPAVAAHTLDEFLALVRAKPGTFNFASGGAGTPNHLAAEYLRMVAGLKLTHVPFKGTGPAIAAVLAGQVQFMMAGLPPSLPQVRAGKLRALAVTSARRSGAAPEVPTVAESGFPGFELGSWHSLLAPARTPTAIVNYVHGEAVRALAHPDVRERFAAQGLEVVGSTPEAFRAHLVGEMAKFAKIIKVAGITVD